MLLSFQIPGASPRFAHHRPSGAAFAFSAKAVTPALHVAYPESEPVVFLFNPLLVKCADGPGRSVPHQCVNNFLQCRKTVRLRRKISDNAFNLLNSWSVPSFCTSQSQWRGICFFCKGRDTSSICRVPPVLLY
jgi:hypothetical protein